MNNPILLISLCEGTQKSPAREHYAHKNKGLNMKAANSKASKGHQTTLCDCICRMGPFCKLISMLACLLLFQAVSSHAVTIHSSSSNTPTWNLELLKYLPFKFHVTPKLRFKPVAESHPFFRLQLEKGMYLKLEKRNKFELKFQVEVTFRVEFLLCLDIQPRYLPRIEETYLVVIAWLFGQERKWVPMGLGGVKLKDGSQFRGLTGCFERIHKWPNK